MQDLLNCVWVRAKSFHSSVILCNSLDCSPPGSSVHGILQARILERVAMPFSRDIPDPGIEPVSYISCIDRQAFFSLLFFFTTNTTYDYYA